jgi:hypothetical protein
MEDVRARAFTAGLFGRPPRAAAGAQRLLDRPAVALARAFFVAVLFFE